MYRTVGRRPTATKGNISYTTLALSKIGGGATTGYSYGYDQLNRLKEMRQHGITGAWNNSSINSTYSESIAYDANGNILKYLRNGAVSKLEMDSLTYQYNRDEKGRLVNNRLNHVRDAVDKDNYTIDIDDQNADNYAYDAIGNLKKDIAEGISNIDWTVYGKIKGIVKTGTTIQYGYDPSGKRIVKQVAGGDTTRYTYYVRDAQGNTMAVYSKLNSEPIKWDEQHLYGSSRLGLWRWDTLTPAQPPVVASANSLHDSVLLGSTQYELSNHLGNVLASISDKKIGVDSSGVVKYYEAEALSQNDYYPFGMGMPERKYSLAKLYRYGFNGKENDNDVKGDGNQIDYGWRAYDSRLGRFLSFDPLHKEYVDLSPFHFAGDNPIRNLDRDGGEPLDFSWNWQYKRFSVNGGKAFYDRTVRDPQLGYVNVQVVHDNWTKRVWFITQGHDGKSYYWKHNPGADQTIRMLGNGKWESFEKQEITQARIGNELSENMQIAVFTTATTLVRIFTGVDPMNIIDFTTTKNNSNQATLGETEEHKMIKNAVLEEGHLPGSQGRDLGTQRLPEEVMRQMSDKHGVEFAQVYVEGPRENGGGGRYYLYSGTANSVSVTTEPGSYLINHTHPGGNTQPSKPDVKYLENQEKSGSKQRSSVILPKNKPAVRFNKNTPTIKQ